MSCPTTYRIKVRGRLDAEWSEWFDNWSISVEEDDGRWEVTTLTGPAIDQAALFGLLWRIRDLNLPLLMVQCVEEQRGAVQGTEGV